jgi:hypothetical protein
MHLQNKQELLEQIPSIAVDDCTSGYLMKKCNLKI